MVTVVPWPECSWGRFDHELSWRVPVKETNTIRMANHYAPSGVGTRAGHGKVGPVA